MGEKSEDGKDIGVIGKMRSFSSEILFSWDSVKSFLVVYNRDVAT